MSAESPFAVPLWTAVDIGTDGGDMSVEWKYRVVDGRVEVVSMRKLPATRLRAALKDERT